MTNAQWFLSQSDPNRDPEIGREGRELLEMRDRGLEIQLKEAVTMAAIMRMVRRGK